MNASTLLFRQCCLRRASMPIKFGLRSNRIHASKILWTRTSQAADFSNNTPTKSDPPSSNNLPSHIFNIPNTITASRIVATPFLGWLVWTHQYESACYLFAASGFTDWLDGYIAQKYNQSTVFGSFLDPLADKLFVSTLAISEVAAGLLPVELGAVVLGRDLLLVAATFYFRAVTRPTGSPFFNTTHGASFEVQPTKLSKANTALQFGLLGAALSSAAWSLPSPDLILPLCYVVGTTTVLSGADYARAALRNGISNRASFVPVTKSQQPAAAAGAAAPTTACSPPESKPQLDPATTCEGEGNKERTGKPEQ